VENDELVLSYIFKEKDISQRKIANHIGLSLGQTNIILHSLVKKGLLKIEKINPRNVKYILTPKGIAKNALRAYNCIINSISNVLALQDELLNIVQVYTDKDCLIFLDYDDDEVYAVLRQIVCDRDLRQVNLLSDIDGAANASKDAVVIIWRNEKVESYRSLGIECINILDGIDDL